MSIQIADCTIRDGGYLLNKNSDPEFVKGIIRGLTEAGIDFIETGFLQDKVNGESIVYHNSYDTIKYLPAKWGKTQYLGFCDNSRYSIDNLNECVSESFKWLRISFAQHEISEALAFCVGAKNKKYHVQCNPMDSISYSDEERKRLLHKVNDVKPEVFSIVDTFGAMDMLDLEHIFSQVDSILDKDIKIGLHSHDNLGLSCALAERMIELAQKHNRDVVVDASLFGMGRGAGNARTELLADFINKHYGGRYDLGKILETINQYIIPLECDVKWGYDLPMYICGTMHSHVDNVYHLQDKYHCSVSSMFDIISKLNHQQRVRYGEGYSKNDFSELDRIYNGAEKSD